MGPVEILFFIVILIFGAVGVVRGYHRELGVTLLLLVALFVLLFLEAQFAGPVGRGLGFLSGSEAGQNEAKALIYSLFLIIVAFISYQGETLVYPGSGRNPGLSFALGLLNGYLLAGSIWFYQAIANWPLLPIVPTYTAVYQATARLLPPAILDWRFVIGLIAVMLILRVWR